MEINAIKSFNQMSKGKKVATIAAGAVAAAGIATTAVAYAKGRKSIGAEELKNLKNIKKVTTPIANGYKQIGSWIKAKSTAAFETVKKFFNKKADNK